MRYCPHCQRLNLGRPVICFYCGRSWAVRLCARGHANPFNAIFCGTCGNSELTDTAGHRWGWMRVIPLWMWLMSIVLLSALMLILPSLFEEVLKELLPLFLLVGLVIAACLWILPPPVGKVLRWGLVGGLRTLGRVISFLVWGAEPKSRGRGRE